MVAIPDMTLFGIQVISDVFFFAFFFFLKKSIINCEIETRYWILNVKPNDKPLMEIEAELFSI